jgi:hypothetical protein
LEQQPDERHSTKRCIKTVYTSYEYSLDHRLAWGTTRE